jgi:hypothetical protein
MPTNIINALHASLDRDGSMVWTKPGMAEAGGMRHRSRTDVAAPVAPPSGGSTLCAGGRARRCLLFPLQQGASQATLAPTGHVTA